MAENKAFSLGDVTVNYDSLRVPVPAGKRRSGPYPYYGASGVVDSVDDYLFEGDYLLIAEDGENLRTRKTAIAFMASGKFWVNNHAHVVQGNHLANSRYLSYVLARTDISGYLSGSTQPKLTQAAMNRIQIWLPGRIRQDSVVAILKALDDKISVNESAIATIDALLLAHFSADMQDAECKAKLGEIIDLKYGKALKEEDRAAGIVPVFGGNGTSGWHDTPLDQGPGIIVGRKGANAGSVSWSPGPFWAIDTSFYVKPVSGKIPMEFLFFLLHGAGLRSLVGDSAIPGLNRDLALNLDVRLPVDRVVSRFSGTARSLLSLSAQKAYESRALAELRDTMLPELISGEIQIRDAEKVIEEVT